MPTLVVGMVRFAAVFDMPTASVGMAPDTLKIKLTRFSEPGHPDRGRAG